MDDSKIVVSVKYVVNMAGNQMILLSPHELKGFPSHIAINFIAYSKMTGNRFFQPRIRVNAILVDLSPFQLKRWAEAIELAYELADEMISPCPNWNDEAREAWNSVWSLLKSDFRREIEEFEDSGGEEIDEYKYIPIR